MVQVDKPNVTPFVPTKIVCQNNQIYLLLLLRKIVIIINNYSLI